MMGKPGYYRTLSGKRAAWVYCELKDADDRMGTSRAIRFAIRFETYGNAASVECFLGYLGALEHDRDMGGMGAQVEHSFQKMVITHMSYSVTCGKISHGHARRASTRGIVSRLMGDGLGKALARDTPRTLASGCHILGKPNGINDLTA